MLARHQPYSASGLLALVLALLVPLPALAVLPITTIWYVTAVPHANPGYGATFVEACHASFETMKVFMKDAYGAGETWYEYLDDGIAPGPCYYRVAGRYGSITYWGYGQQIPQCPAHSGPQGDQCICDAGYLEEAGACVPLDLRISLNGPANTKALPAGQALTQRATVKQNGAAVSGRGVSISLGSGGSMGGITDAAGEFHFTYTPPAYATTEALTATCDGCTAPATKTITVDAAEMMCTNGGH